MKSIMTLLLTALLGFALGLYLPWWSIALAGFIVAVSLHPRPGAAFLAGFLGALILWGGIALLRSQANEHILAHRISKLLLKRDDPLLLILLTSGIGGLVGGLGALCGSFLRDLFSPVYVD